MINYINGDEALFEDASLPRDRFWFRIANWVNTRKQDWKTANSWIQMAQFVAKNIQKNAWMPINYSAPSYYREEYKNSYNTSDINFTTFSWITVSQALLDNLKVATLWNPEAKIENNHVKITKSWTYVIQVYWEFVYSATWNAQMQLVLWQWDWTNFWLVWKVSWRQWWLRNNLQFTYVAYVKPWYFTAWYMTDCSWDFVCQTSINFYRLS